MDLKSQLLLFVIVLCAIAGARSDSGACPSRSLALCPVSCFRPDPVCGVDGITYWCGCSDAQCADVEVAKLGFCNIGNVGSAPQALLLVHIVWLIVLGFSVIFGIL